MQYRDAIRDLSVQVVTNRQATISGLTPSTEYAISVAAVNSAGTGVYSDEVVHKTAGETSHMHDCCIIITKCVTSITSPTFFYIG